VIDDDVDTLRQKVIEVAEGNGEREGALHNLTRAQNLGFPPGQIVFDLQGISTQYSDPYAACVVFPALKVAGRFFRREEVAESGMILHIFSS